MNEHIVEVQLIGFAHRRHPFPKCKWNPSSYCGSGGAVDISVTDTNTTLTGDSCLFSECTAGGCGGAVYVCGINGVSIMASNFSESNCSGNGGAACANSVSASVRVSDCEMTGYDALWVGDEMWFYDCTGRSAKDDIPGRPQGELITPYY
jgi:hypothetical protein